MSAYYNENDPKAAAWLRELIVDGLIAPGDVDERSIADVKAEDLKGYTQCHFFAGIGGWSYALRLAGWPDSKSAWTGSPPCQPFSVAGKGKGTKDKRHLWPEFRRLIAECGPSVVFGEQVASKAGREWLSRVRAEMEALGYGVGAADLCAASVNAPHIRQRLWWVGHADNRMQGEVSRIPKRERAKPKGDVRLADSTSLSGPQYGREPGEGPRGKQEADHATECRADHGRLGNTSSAGSRRDAGAVSREKAQGQGSRQEAGREPDESQPPSFWDSSVLIPCADGKARRVEPSIQPLAHGVSGRVGLLRGAGNAIVPQAAQAFIEAYVSVANHK